MKLIGSLTSPYVRKVRIVMAEKKLDYQFVIEDVWGNDNILKMNPLGKVPCLVMEGQDTITGSVFDSRVIVEYLDTLSPVGKLIPPSGRERIEVRTWEALADGVLDACIAARLEQTYAGRGEGERSQAWIDRQMGKVHASLRAMSQGVGEKPWCSSNHFSLADICRRLRARLPRLPLRPHRLAHRLSQPRAPAREALGPPQLRRHHPTGVTPPSPACGRGPG